MTTLYKTGRVTIANGSTKVYGVDTAWLINEVKATDLIVLNGQVHEIQEVTTSSEITLTDTYIGDKIESGEYTIIRIAAQVLAADLAEKIQQLVDNYNSRETHIAKILAEHDKYVQILKKLRIYIDSDGNLAQSDEITTPSTVIIDGVEYPLTDSSDVSELLQELGINH